MAKKRTTKARSGPKMKTSRTLGIQPDRLRAARERAGFSQFELAKLTNIHPSTISHVESGVKDLHALSLVSLARALSVSADYLLGLSAEMGRK